MLGFLIDGQNVAFTAALVLMLLIGVVEAAGLGGGMPADLDFDAEVGEASLLSWLNVGRLPLLMLLVVFLAAFGLIGLTGQRLVAAVVGAPAPWWIAVPAALAASLPVTHHLGRLLARVLPRDETTAVSRDSLIGRVAVIVTGVAAKGSPAQGRARDAHGQPHYVMIEPDLAGDRFEQGDDVLIVRRAGATFFAIRNESMSLKDSKI